jgi:hypothetical protein
LFSPRKLFLCYQWCSTDLFCFCLRRIAKLFGSPQSPPVPLHSAMLFTFPYPLPGSPPVKTTLRSIFQFEKPRDNTIHPRVPDAATSLLMVALGGVMINFGLLLCFEVSAIIISTLTLCFTCCWCCRPSSRFPLFSTLLTLNSLVYVILVLRSIYGGLFLVGLLYLCNRPRSAQVIAAASFVLIIVDSVSVPALLRFVVRLIACGTILFHGSFVEKQ